MTLHPVLAVLNTAQLLDFDRGVNVIRFLPRCSPLFCPKLFLGSTSCPRVETLENM